jgi:CheY-like chemotaxis protein
MLLAVLRNLRLPGWAVASGEEALEFYREHAPSIGFVMLDVLMPGLSGPRTLTALRRVNPDLRCCFMTGWSGGLLRVGATRVFAKPINLNELARLLETECPASV